MRIWVLLGVAAAGVGIGFLLRPAERDPGRAAGGRAPQAPPDQAPAAVHAPATALLDVRAAPTSPLAQKSLAAFAIAQAARGRAAVPDLVDLLRQPDIQGDGIVFVYAGDLWTVGRAGGVAARLTTLQIRAAIRGR